MLGLVPPGQARLQRVSATTRDDVTARLADAYRRTRAGLARAATDRLHVGTEAVRAVQKAYDTVAARAADRPRPVVYFEEWDEPMISGIHWVSELVEIAGGREAFPQLAPMKSARDRIVTSDQVIAAGPDVILASWCGKKVRPDRIATGPRRPLAPPRSRPDCGQDPLWVIMSGQVPRTETDVAPSGDAVTAAPRLEQRIG